MHVAFYRTKRQFKHRVILIEDTYRALHDAELGLAYAVCSAAATLAARNCAVASSGGRSTAPACDGAQAVPRRAVLPASLPRFAAHYIFREHFV